MALIMYDINFACLIPYACKSTFIVWGSRWICKGLREAAIRYKTDSQTDKASGGSYIKNHLQASLIYMKIPISSEIRKCVQQLRGINWE